MATDLRIHSTANASIRRLIARIWPIVLACMLASASQAFELGLGIGFLESGDDRWQPAGRLEFIADKGIRGDLTAHQMIFGPITQTTVIVSGGKEFKVFWPEHLRASVGGVYLQEITELEFGAGVDPAMDRHEVQHNLGAQFGLHLRNNFKGPVTFGFSWQSHVFLAGPAAGLFLATGRKQVLTFSGGFHL